MSRRSAIPSWRTGSWMRAHDQTFSDANTLRWRLFVNNGDI
jgi:hypothetical protein